MVGRTVFSLSFRTVSFSTLGVAYRTASLQILDDNFLKTSKDTSNLMVFELPGNLFSFLILFFLFYFFII